MNRNALKGGTKRLAGGMAMVLLAMGVFGSQSAQAQLITNSKHDLTPANTGTGAEFTPTTGGAAAAEICVFCHTPHRAATSDFPLWNRAGSGATYITYNSLGTATLTGAIAPVGSVSLACLSCHDGTVAMNVMVNTPGSGTTTTWAGAWAAGTTEGDTGKMLSTSYAMLSTDLKNDHPIGAPYGGGIKLDAAFPLREIVASEFKDPDFKLIKYVAAGGNKWWVDSGLIAGARERSDVLLYTRTSQLGTKADGTTLTVTGDSAYVECGSCHDPHSGKTTFLRMANTGSALCLACHNK